WSSAAPSAWLRPTITPTAPRVPSPNGGWRPDLAAGDLRQATTPTIGENVPHLTPQSSGGIRESSDRPPCHLPERPAPPGQARLVGQASRHSAAGCHRRRVRGAAGRAAGEEGPDRLRLVPGEHDLLRPEPLQLHAQLPRRRPGRARGGVEGRGPDGGREARGL